jgi:peptide chain release factor 2
MLKEELQGQLELISPDIDIVKGFYKNSNVEQLFKDLEKQVNNEDFWKNPDQIKISKEFQRVKLIVEKYKEIMHDYSENIELLEIFEETEETKAELEDLSSEIRKLCKKIRVFKIEILLGNSDDDTNCFLSINSGAGGTESQDWSDILLRMYLRFCESNNFKVDVIDYQAGEEAGIKSVTLFIKGRNTFGLLKSEHGVHRLVRISPFDANKRRHTSFSSVSVTPEVADEKVEIKDDELRIDTYRAGGAGGQHVNKTDSAVRITHLPTRIVVQCQNERSQLQNKQTAMKVLMSKLIEKQKRDAEEKAASVEKKKIEWGSQIRSYVLHPYKMVKDLRTNFESPQPNLVLDGQLMPFIESYLVQFCKI